MFTKCLRNVLTVELSIEFLIEINTMGGDFQSINCSSFIDPVESIVIKQFTSCRIKMNTILSIFMTHKTKLVPVSCLPDSRCVLIGKKTKIDIFAGELELIHKSTGIALINSNLLISVNSNQSKSNLLNIDIMNSGMSKDVISIERNTLNVGIIESTISVNWKIVIFIPSVSYNKTTRQIISTIRLKSKDCSWNIFVCSFKDIVDN